MRTRDVILQELRAAVAEERRSAIRVLHLLKEVERTQIYLEMGHSTLFEFAMKELGYSAGAAYRRLQSMKLLKDLPALEEKIQDGSLSLCVAAKTQSFFRQENLRRKEAGEERLDSKTKEEVINSVLGTSNRECEAKLAALLPEAPLPKEKERPISKDKSLIQFVASRELLEKIEKLKGLTAHQNFEARYDRLFEILVDLGLEKFDPDRKPEKPKSDQTISAPKKAAANSSPSSLPDAFPTLETEQPTKLSKALTSKASTKDALTTLAFKAKPGSPRRTRYIPMAVRREVWKRDCGMCTYRDPKTGQRCGSRHGIQYDHIRPYAWGGENTVQNLRLRCGRHNRYTAQLMDLESLRKPGDALGAH